MQAAKTRTKKKAKGSTKKKVQGTEAEGGDSEDEGQDEGADTHGFDVNHATRKAKRVWRSFGKTEKGSLVSAITPNHHLIDAGHRTIA